MSQERNHAGFKEQYRTATDVKLLKPSPKREKVRLGDGGRFVIPAAMREQMGIKPGDVLVAHVVDGELKLISQRAAIARAQKIAQKLKKPGESVVDEFIAERREEQQRSDERFDRLHTEGMALKRAKR